MSAVIINNDERDEIIMTDFQFKAIVKMILDIAENTDDLEKVKKSLKELLYGDMKQ